MPSPLIFLWDNFGPLHADRCEAVAATGSDVTGLEVHGRSRTYDWTPETGPGFNKVTLFPQTHNRGWKLLHALIKFRRKQGRAVWFLCHYDWPEIFAFAIWLRLRGDKVFTMGCSKFDDISRRSGREWLKTMFFLPYQGAIGSGIRSRDYFRFMGIRKDRVAGEYNTVSQDRIRKLSGAPAAPEGLPHEQRHFTIVARLVPKKNLFMALEAYALYAQNCEQRRSLHICGNGPLDNDLKARATELGISDHTVFHGFVQTAEIARLFGSTLALILPSIEEQFGNVVPEAQAMGLPIIISDNCGARDLLVRSGVNGFIIEPDNPQGVAFFMKVLSENQSLWRQMCDEANKRAPMGDVAAFATGVKFLSETK